MIWLSLLLLVRSFNMGVTMLLVLSTNHVGVDLKSTI